MSREVRRVPPNWVHPKDPITGRFIPLFDGCDFKPRVAEWEVECAKWNRGEFPSYVNEDDKKLSYEEWAGPRPNRDRYMPVWSPEVATHYMMYQTTSEGTPISPAFATPEELARWLADNNVSSFGPMTATYDQWLRIAQGGYAPSMVLAGGELKSGVEADL